MTATARGGRQIQMDLQGCEIIAVMSDLGRYEVTGFHPEALDALFDAIRATHVNGGVLIAQVRALEVDDPAR